jgi:hypothetical protein
MDYNLTFQPHLSTLGASDVQNWATTERESSHHLQTIEEAAVWSPSYICIDGRGIDLYPCLVTIQLLMHEIWMWENKIADDDQATAESGADIGSQNDAVERVPPESELLPCHYFDFFYGTSHGGVLAILLGRLRLRIDEATDHFQKITRAMITRRDLIASGSPLRRIWKERRHRPENLLNALHETVAKHSVNTAELGSTDQLFRDPASIATKNSLRLEGPRQTQTCVVISASIDGDPERAYLLRTFRSGLDDKEHIDTLGVSFADWSSLTILQVLRAATAAASLLRPKIALGTSIATIFDTSSSNTNTAAYAVHDYEHFYTRSPSSRKESASEPVALILNVGWSADGIWERAGCSAKEVPPAQPSLGKQVKRDGFADLMSRLLAYPAPGHRYDSGSFMVRRRQIPTDQIIDHPARAKTHQNQLPNLGMPNEEGICACTMACAWMI